jgi:hypothetical protein
MPGVIMMGSLFILFVVEMWLNAKTGGHSHGSATGNEFAGGAPPAAMQAAMNNAMNKRNSYDSQRTMLTIRDDKKGWVENTYPAGNFSFKDNDEMEPRSEMPPWFIVFYEQYVRQREEMVNMVNRAMPALPSYPQEKAPEAQVSYFDEDVEQAVDPLVLKKQSLQITLIEGGILSQQKVLSSCSSPSFSTRCSRVLVSDLVSQLCLTLRVAGSHGRLWSRSAPLHLLDKPLVSSRAAHTIRIAPSVSSSLVSLTQSHLGF